MASLSTIEEFESELDELVKTNPADAGLIDALIEELGSDDDLLAVLADDVPKWHFMFNPGRLVMTLQPLNTQACVTATTGWAFLSLGAPASAVLGMKITPLYISMNQSVIKTSAVGRGLSAAERKLRIENNPLRAAAIGKGRKRLAKIAERTNPGFRPLAVLRLAAGMSQTELAEKMQMKQPNIARLERSPGDLSLSTLQKLALVLGVDLREVIAAVDATNGAIRRAKAEHG
jgi:DNA-binding Xre family transcriptional regulator